MRTIIRLQRIGIKNTQQYNIIAQPNKRRIGGRHLEHLGFWFPTNINSHGRSIILNKARIRYWISVGANYRRRVQQFLTFHDMAPAPWIAFGTKTIVQKEINKRKRFDKGIEEFLKKADMIDGYDNMFLEGMRERDEENLLVRKAKFQRAIERYVEEDEELIDEEGMSADDIRDIGDSDIKTRTMKFLKLKQLYEDIEMNDPTLSPIRKETLYKKMNSLADQGLLTPELIETELKDGVPSLDDSIVQLYEDRKKRGNETIEKAVLLLEPVSKEEFLKTASINTKSPAKKLRISVDDFYKEVEEEEGRKVTKADLHIFCRIHGSRTFGYKLTDEDIKYATDGHIKHTNYPLTPMPDYSEYDPKDWFDIEDKNDFSFTQNYKGENKWFQIPRTRALRKQRYQATEDEWQKPVKEALLNRKDI